MNQYHGDITKGSLLVMAFNTKDSALNPVTCVGGYAVAYKDGLDGVSSTAGMVLTRDFGRVGAHSLRINTSDDFYTPNSDYSIMLRDVNVDGKVYDEFIGVFSIGNRNMRGTDGVSVSSEDSVLLLAGTTSFPLYVRLFDSVTGKPKTGLLYNSPGMNIGYVRDRSSLVNIAEKTLADCVAPFDAGGFIEVDPTNSPGLYRFDVPDSVLLAGATDAVLYFMCDTVSTKTVRIALATYAQPGDEMDLINAPNATAFDLLANVIWTFTGGRTLSSLGTFVSDVWAYVTRTINGDVNVGNTSACKANVSELATAEALAAVPTAAGIVTAMEADGSKVDHIWGMTEVDNGVRRFTANALEQAPVGGGGLALAAKTLTNKAVQDKSTGVITYYDDDGVTPILILTPTDADNETIRIPS